VATRDSIMFARALRNGSYDRRRQHPPSWSPTPIVHRGCTRHAHIMTTSQPLLARHIGTSVPGAVSLQNLWLWQVFDLSSIAA